MERVSLLVVDDRPENLVAISAILGGGEYDIVTASSGPEALRALLKRDFAVILLDVLMPEMDGYEVARLVRDRDRNKYTPIIFLTALATDLNHIFRGYSVGAVDYLTKPLEPDVVRAKVAVFAELYRKEMRIREQAELLREAERREREAWYSVTLRSIGDAVVAADAKEKIQLMNPVAEKLVGWSSVEARGRPLADLIAVIQEKNGHDFFVEESRAPIQSEEGVLLGSVLVFRDVTARRREEERRAFLSKAFSLLLSSLNYDETLSAVARLSVEMVAEGCVVHVFSDKMELEHSIVLHRDPKIEAELRREVEKRPMIADQIPLELETRENSETVVSAPLLARESRFGVMKFFSGSKRHYGADDVLMFETLGNRAALAIENSRLYEAAQKAIRLRDEFLSIASHELRTPITPLKLQLQMLKNMMAKRSGGALPAERIDKIMSVTDRQMERLTRLIEELLDVSRIGVGKMKLEKEEVDLGKLVTDIVAQFADELKNIKSDIEVEAQSVVGYWDRLRLEQVVINLLANAMKYGGGKPIRITVSSKGDVACFSVHDHGIGIAKEDQARIFDRYERAASSKNFGGLGLGLYITRQILESHGGKVWVESEPGEGSTFYVELPVRAEEMKAA